MQALHFEKIGLIGKQNIAKRKIFLKELIAFLKNAKKKILFDENTAGALFGKRQGAMASAQRERGGLSEGVLKSRATEGGPELYKKGLEKADVMKRSDLVIVLGGDGTLLKTARCCAKTKVPVLGVNTGNVGFMTEVSPKKLFPLLEKIFKGKYHLDERFLLRVTVYRRGQKKFTSLALNEAVINQGGFARLIDLFVEVNKRKLAVYRTDGLIISTPTGSTGHSLSAGGPIVHPKIAGIILTPICPVKLGFRPIVIPNSRQITVKLQTEWRAEKKPVVLTIDGQIVVNLKLGDIVKIRKSSRIFQLIRAPGRKYYRMLRQKLNWGA